MRKSAADFVASPEAVPVASLAGKERAAADEVRGECRGVPRAPQRQTQLLLLPNSRKVHTEAPKEDVLINGNLRLDSFLERA